VLRAPFDGVVADISGELGEYATPSPPGIPTPPAIDLIDDSCMFVSAPIDEVDAASIKRGQESRIVLDAIKGKSFPGKVKRIAPYVLELEKQARTVEVEVEFIQPPKEENLLIGYSADVEIVYATRSSVLRIPTQTLLEGKRVLLYRANDGMLEERKVETGLRHVDARTALRYLAVRRCTGSLFGFCVRLGALQPFGRDEAALAQLPRTHRFPAADIRNGAYFLDARGGGVKLLFREPCLRLKVVVPQLQQHLPGLDPLALLDPQMRDLPAHRRRQLGAAAGLDRSRAGVAHRRLHRAALGLGQLHANRGGAREIPECRCQQQQRRKIGEVFQGAVSFTAECHVNFPGPGQPC
jgi:hypothetical protein